MPPTPNATPFETKNIEQMGALVDSCQAIGALLMKRDCREEEIFNLQKRLLTKKLENFDRGSDRDSRRSGRDSRRSDQDSRRSEQDSSGSE